jgi:hypothetical protein
MKWLLSICALVCFTSVSAQTMTPILLEAQAGRETGVFSKSPVVQRAILLKPSMPTDTALMFYRGWSGIANIKSENDWHRNLNFLKNNTNLFAQAGIALVVMDCPSDENSVGAGNTPLGCSYGAISSKWLARNLGAEIQGSIHSAAQTVASPRMRAYGYSAESFDMSSLKAPALNIHHGDDQCVYTPYSTVLAYSKNNLITVKGGIPNGDVCGGGHYHSFEGREEVSSKAIIQWIKTGQVQSSIGE